MNLVHIQAASRPFYASSARCWSPTSRNKSWSAAGHRLTTAKNEARRDAARRGGRQPSDESDECRPGCTVRPTLRIRAVHLTSCHRHVTSNLPSQSRPMSQAAAHGCVRYAATFTFIKSFGTDVYII